MLTKDTELEPGMAARAAAGVSAFWEYLSPSPPENGALPGAAAFFDIETTGFAADVTALYLVGCLYPADGRWRLIQWFADDNQSEEAILRAFFGFVERFPALIHYNGTGFDLPYLARKCAKHGLPFSVPQAQSFDLFHELRHYRSLFRLPDLKQRTLEGYLGIQRHDPYTGGELIRFYGDYLKAKYAHLPEEAAYREAMLLHNAEDLTGLAGILPLLAVPAAFRQCVAAAPATSCRERNELLIPLSLPLPLPQRLQASRGGASFSAAGGQGILRVKLCQDELKFFYSNYKDYYYLPEEDMAVHKSVAFYVDKEFRVRAKAANCYSRHTGCFVPQYSELLSPFFKVDYHDKTTYLETTDEFLQDTDILTQYARHLLGWISG